MSKARDRSRKLARLKAKRSRLNRRIALLEKKLAGERIRWIGNSKPF